ncbi:SURF1 family protein [Streptomyces sp. 7-21]|uniref:SURF1 family protein n=1 Tax=Streptomyces sp. 7-21 TaxID=2802283 RepID=UPI00191E0306|nr:SURF1 family protein [Streptomyces sp. 7-21]MBL1068149.1 SURF1 family protein [Streptomyces sp. 7-21]
MYRFLLTPRWWAINVFVVLAIPVCLVAGLWQLGRFEDQVDSHREQQERVTDTSATPRPLAELLPLTGETVNQHAAVTGTYDREHEQLVPGRELDGRTGFYVMTPLRPEDGAAAVPVVRGWLPGEPDPAQVPAPPDGEVTVTGLLQAPESPSEVGARTGLPDGQIGVIGAASLINVLPYPVEDAWLTVTEAQAPMATVPGTAPTGTGLDMDAFQNLGYTAEWFVFAAFALFMWYRLFRREVEMQRDAELGLGPEAETGATAGPGSDGPQGGGPGAGLAAAGRP